MLIKFDYFTLYNINYYLIIIPDIWEYNMLIKFDNFTLYNIKYYFNQNTKHMRV